MDKLISQLIPAPSNLLDTDLIEAQRAGEVFSRKFTGAQLRSALMGNPVILQAGIVTDKTLTAIVPAGYMLFCIVFQEKSGNTAMLDLGTTPGGNEVFINQEITASDYTTVVIQRIFSLVAATTLYLNDDTAPSTWNGATVDAYFVFTPVIPGGMLVNGTTVVSYYEGAYGFSSPPTGAEMIVVLGLPTLYPAASIFIVNDTLGASFLIYTNAVNWYYLSAGTELL